MTTENSQQTTEQVELKITIGEKKNDAGLTLSGVIVEEAEVVEQDEWVEPEVARHVEDKYNVTIHQ